MKSGHGSYIFEIYKKQSDATLGLVDLLLLGWLHAMVGVSSENIFGKLQVVIPQQFLQLHHEGHVLSVP